METNQIFSTSDEDQGPSLLRSSCTATRFSRDEYVVDQDPVIGTETTALVKPDSNDHAKINNLRDGDKK